MNLFVDKFFISFISCNYRFLIVSPASKNKHEVFEDFFSIESNVAFQNLLLLKRKSRCLTVEHKEKGTYFSSFFGKAYKVFEIFKVNFLLRITSSWDVNQLNVFIYSLVKIRNLYHLRFDRLITWISSIGNFKKVYFLS